MYYVAPDGRIQDDGLGGEHPPYALDARGQRLPVPPQISNILAMRYEEEVVRRAPQPRPMPQAPMPQAPMQAAPPPQPNVAMPFTAQDVQAMTNMFPLGDMIAKLTSAVGIQPCEPCKRRQEMLNAIGARATRRFWG